MLNNSLDIYDTDPAPATEEDTCPLCGTAHRYPVDSLCRVCPRCAFVWSPAVAGGQGRDAGSVEGSSAILAVAVGVAVGLVMVGYLAGYLCR